MKRTKPHITLHYAERGWIMVVVHYPNGGHTRAYRGYDLGWLLDYLHRMWRHLEALA